MTETTTSPLVKFCLFFVRRYRVTILIFLSIIVLGAVSYSTLLNREGFPEIEVPYATITVPYFVNDLNAVNTEVTVPVETALATMSEVKQVNSTTTDNFAIFVIEFVDGTNSKDGIDAVKSEVTDVVSFPDGVTPEFSAFSSGQFFGEYDVLITVTSDNSSSGDLSAKASEIALALQSDPSIANAEAVQLVEEESNPRTGLPVEIQTRFNRIGLLNKNGELVFTPAIAIGLTKGPSQEDVVAFSEDVNAAVARLSDDVMYDRDTSTYTFSDGYTLVITADFADSVNDQINSLQSNAVSGLIAVTIIVFLFISLRAALLATLFMPTVMSATFVALYLLGYSLNVITLFSLILVLGLFVDDAIVVIEAIDYKKKQGLSGISAIRSAIGDIGPADIMGTITTVLVFGPLIFTSGVLGDFIRLIPITVVVALLLSLIIALTLIPFLSHIFILNTQVDWYRLGVAGTGKLHAFVAAPLQAVINRIGIKVSTFVRWYLNSRVLTLLILIGTLGLVGGGGFFASKLSFSVFPTPKDSVSLQLTLRFAEGTSISDAELKTMQVEDTLTSYNKYITRVDYYDATKQAVTMKIMLTPIGSRDETAQELATQIQRSIEEDVPDVRSRTEVVSAGPPVSEYPFAMQLFGDDTQALIGAANLLKEVIQNEIDLPGEDTVTDVIVENVTSINKVNGRRYVNIKAKFSDSENVTALDISLKDAIEREFGDNPVLERDLRSELAAFGVEKADLGFDSGQESDNLDSFNSTIFALILSLILMYGLLVFQYNSFLQPVLIFLAIPLSFPLLFPGLYYTNNVLSFFVMLGVIGLVGIVVNNTIMLTDFANQSQNKGKKPADAITEAIRIRFRPVITTTATTVAGLLPLALSDPFWEPLAIAIILGLISSSILVLTVFPVFYVIVEKIRSVKQLLPSIDSEV